MDSSNGIRPRALGPAELEQVQKVIEKGRSAWSREELAHAKRAIGYKPETQLRRRALLAAYAGDELELGPDALERALTTTADLGKRALDETCLRMYGLVADAPMVTSAPGAVLLGVPNRGAATPLGVALLAFLRNPCPEEA